MKSTTPPCTPSELLEAAQPLLYYCRGCGGPLPHGSSGRFHPECLRTDRRRALPSDDNRKRDDFRFSFDDVSAPTVAQHLKKSYKSIRAAPYRWRLKLHKVTQSRRAPESVSMSKKLQSNSRRGFNPQTPN